ncbi:hypothetical protein SDJN02_20145, partial [Cucurbita argyrosperma subsp. argyrosperma]
MDTPPPLRPEPTSGRRDLRRTTPFQFLNFDAFPILFLVISLCFIFVVSISPFYSFSFSFRSFKPQSTWKSLDFLCLALVLFAIACGLLSKNNGENTVREEIYRASVTSNDSELSYKSNPSIPNQWNGYTDRTDQILLHYPPEIAGVEYWRLSGGGYITNYQSISSDSLQHCRNLKEFEEGSDSKRVTKAAFSVKDEEISPSFSPLYQISVPPLVTPPQISSPPGAVVVAEVERINEGDGGFEPELLGEDFQAMEVEISKNEKQREVESKETKRKKNKNKNKMKKWQKGVENFKEFVTPQHRFNRNLSPPPAPGPPVTVHQYQISSIVGETKRGFPAPPESSPQKLIAVRTQNSTVEQPRSGALAPPSTTAELQILLEGKSKRNENAERKGARFCGSPDVNSKADSFIETFRAGLKLERMNSMKERQRKTRTSILGRKGPEQ